MGQAAAVGLAGRVPLTVTVTAQGFYAPLPIPQPPAEVFGLFIEYGAVPTIGVRGRDRLIPRGAIIGSDAMNAVRTPKGLVNNAGFGLGGPAMHQPVAEVRQVYEVSVLGAVTVSQGFLPTLGTEGGLAGGRPGSLRLAGESLASFSALSDVEACAGAFTDSVRRELMIYGIDVIAIGPGAVGTPIWEKSRGPILAFMRGQTTAHC